MITAVNELPITESALIEFKSSRTGIDKLGQKLCKAASSFSNSGGGIFLAGINNDGDADGGISPFVGRTSISDWVDKILQSVKPAVTYKTELITNSDGRGSIEAGNVVLAVEFLESNYAPHMSSDNIYYVRAGAHSAPASNFLVEALIAKRGYQKPMLVHRFRRDPKNSSIIQLCLVSLTSAPAVNIVLTIDPLGESISKAAPMFPLQIPLIDRSHPFEMDYGVAIVPKDPVERAINVTATYEGIDGCQYILESLTDPYKEIPPLRFHNETDNIVSALKDIAKAVESPK